MRCALAGRRKRGKGSQDDQAKKDDGLSDANGGREVGEIRAAPAVVDPNIESIVALTDVILLAP